MNHELVYLAIKRTGLTVIGCATVAKEHPTASPATFHQCQDVLVRVDWDREPTEEEIEKVNLALANVNPAEISRSEVERASAKKALNLVRTFEWNKSDEKSFLNELVGTTDILTQIDELPNTVAGMKRGLKLIAQEVVHLRSILLMIAKLVNNIRITLLR